MTDSGSFLKNYAPLAGFVVLVALVGVVVFPLGFLRDYWRPAVLAFVCGALVGVSEIATRYKDEPLHAIRSPFGLIYVVLNGSLSVVALTVLLRYKDQFPAVTRDMLLAAVTAGFGAVLVMRAKLAVVKGPDGKDISLGTDFVISAVLQLVDKNVDRLRAKNRQAIVVRHLRDIRQLGSFGIAAKYLLASLLAFQNLDPALKGQLSVMISDYEKQTLPDDIKYLALGFVFLTIVGESHFGSVLQNAAAIRTQDTVAVS